MKLIIREYLSSLKEREELDAVLPDLLLEMGLTVFSNPGIGVREHGVDVAAVGDIDDKEKKVYLFSIKAGNLTRSDWDIGQQALRPSLNEILDTYIPKHIPEELKTLKVEVCLCFGGDLNRNVEEDVRNFMQQNSSDNITFSEWNGNEISLLIYKHFLNENLLQGKEQSLLRKSLALIDEPEASFRYFSEVVKSLSAMSSSTPEETQKLLIRINLCLWILFSWSRKDDNIESAYLASEFALLHAWKISKSFLENNKKKYEKVIKSFMSLLTTYEKITISYCEKVISPNVSNLYGLSMATHSQIHIDVNLKMFDILGRVSLLGLWMNWSLHFVERDDIEAKKRVTSLINNCCNQIKLIIENNPILFLPIKDDQNIEINLALMLFSTTANNDQFSREWLYEMASRAFFTLKTWGIYPTANSSYTDLLDHPIKSEEYYKENTSASMLYPFLALWAVILNDDKLFKKIQEIKSECLEHSNFQLCFPNSNSEDNFYTFDKRHGSVLSGVLIEKTFDEYKEQIINECNLSNSYEELPAIKNGFWPIVLLACRHHRIPVPPHMMLPLFSELLDENKV